MIVYVFIFLYSISAKILNLNLPSCKNCVHFILHKELTPLLSTCKKYGTKNLITDIIRYEYADMCRYDNTKCGKNGKDFEEKFKMF